MSEIKEKVVYVERKPRFNWIWRLTFIGVVFIAGMWTMENAKYDDGVLTIKGYQVAWTEHGFRVGKSAIQKAKESATEAFVKLKAEAEAAIPKRDEVKAKVTTERIQLEEVREDTVPATVNRKDLLSGPEFERKFARAYAEMINSRISKLRTSFQWDYPVNTLPQERKDVIEANLQSLYDNTEMRAKCYNFARVHGVEGHKLSLYVESIKPYSSAVIAAANMG